jgi:hypothetical protein
LLYPTEEAPLPKHEPATRNLAPTQAIDETRSRS